MLERALSDLTLAATEARGLTAYRSRVLELLAGSVRFDGALFHALSPRVPLSTGVVVGLRPEVVMASMRSWDELGDVLSPVRERANREIVASDDEVLSPRSAARRRLEALVLRPFGHRSICIVHLVVRERVRSAIVLLSRQAHGFDAQARARLRLLAPAIAAGDVLQQLLEGASAIGAPTRLRCLDQRLTPRQREVVEHVALGHSNAEIGAALGLSRYSVRNHLVRVFSCLGAANRADVVRRAVLLPES